MAKKRRSRKRGRSRRSSHSSHTRRHRRRRSGGGGGGGGYGLKPSGDDVKLMGACALYGYLEKASSTEADHLLNKVPKPFDQLGFTGNTALVLWAASVVTKNRWVRLAARGVANVAAYQLGHRGKLFDQSGERFALSGWDDEDVANAIEAASVAGLDPMGASQGY